MIHTCIQVADLIKGFDDRVKEMCELRVQVQMFIASQVWYSIGRSDSRNVLLTELYHPSV